jgi:signal peptidase I
MNWNLEATIKHAEDNAFPDKRSHGVCATYVKRALQAGGLEYWTCDARYCGAGLEAHGFIAIADERTDTGVYQRGDVVVVDGSSSPEGPLAPQPIGKGYGHIAIYNGKLWYSDYEQQSKEERNPVYPGDSYQKVRARYKLYRYKGMNGRMGPDGHVR